MPVHSLSNAETLRSQFSAALNGVSACRVKAFRPTREMSASLTKRQQHCIAVASIYTGFDLNCGGHRQRVRYAEPKATALARRNCGSTTTGPLNENEVSVNVISNVETHQRERSMV